MIALYLLNYLGMNVGAEQLSALFFLALGSFEAAFSGLPNIKAIDVGSTKVDCKRVLELLPSMPWAAQLERLGLASTNAEGKAYF